MVHVRLISFALFALILAAPGVRAADTGTITGTVGKSATVYAVIALNREDDKKYPGKIDAGSGKLTIPGLPLNAKFDVLIDHGAARLEGVNMAVPRSDYEVEQPLTKDDVAALKKEMMDLNKFEDVIEVLAIRGNIQHAAVLVNKRRTKPFYESKPGEIIWRLELWHFEKPDETWIKVQDELFLVLYRERLQQNAYDKKSVTLDPKLGGVAVTDKAKAVDLGKIELPDEKPGVRFRGESK